MKYFTDDQRALLVRVLNSLNREGYIEDFDVELNNAHAFFDGYQVLIESPMENALQFKLANVSTPTELLESVVTDSVKEQIGIERIVLALFGKVQLEAFHNEWDGLTLQEGNMEG